MKSVRPTDSTSLFTLKWLPWIIAATALAFYVTTVNPWLSLLGDWTSLTGSPVAAARTAGWTNQPENQAPVYYLLTYPLRWLPEHRIPAALNLFSAICAALTLWQLARSVSLLPHDRTRAQRDREDHEFALLTIPLAWIPPLMAAFVCGLQLTFWEHATNSTVEMLDLLIFAYVIRCILEYRIDEKESRLYRAAFVFAAGMANNLSMIAYFPLFIVSLVWTRKLLFFNLRFLGRIALFGLAGLLLYLVMPLVASSAADSPYTFWQYLKATLLIQKQLIFVFPKTTLLLMALYSIIPVFLFSIRWAASFGDPSKIGVIFTTLIFHLMHLIVLLACLWVSLDPAFSPRRLAATHDYAFIKYFSFLTLYYLGALNIGYFSGYFLLAFRALGTRLRPATGFAKTTERAAVVFVIVLFVTAPAALLYRNLPQIRITNGPVLKQLAAATADGLPKSGILIADDSDHLMLTKAWLADNGKQADYVPAHSFLLKSPAYHNFLARKHPGKWQPWPAQADLEVIEDGTLVANMMSLAKSNNLTYLQPSFGYYFEVFQPLPHGLALHLKTYPTGFLVPPPPDAQTVSQNEEFWDNACKNLFPVILAQTTPPDPNRVQNLAEKFFEAIYLRPEKNQMALVAGAHYSRSLVWWGVQLQKAGEFEKAARHFETALKLNPDNAAAEVNLEFNRDYRAGKSFKALTQSDIENSFGKLRSWESALNQNGPYDEPTLCFGQGYVFLRGGNLRQSADCFARVRSLVTNDIPSRLWLAQIHTSTHLPDLALDYLKEVRDCAARTPGAQTNLVDLFAMEATALFAKGEADKAMHLIEAEVQKRPNNPTVLAAANRTYTEQGYFTNALAIVGRQLEIFPDDISLIFSKGTLSLQAGIFDDAIAAFDTVLNTETNNASAFLNRAITKLRADRLDEARKDYEALQRLAPTAHQVDFGLAEIALRKGDTNTVLRHYESYLSHAPTNSAEWLIVSNRVREYRSPAPAKTK